MEWLSIASASNLLPLGIFLVQRVLESYLDRKIAPSVNQDWGFNPMVGISAVDLTSTLSAPIQY
jgi:hypothetical protein